MPGQIKAVTSSAQTGWKSYTQVFPTGPNGWSDTTITFKVPATLAGGGYTITAQMLTTSALGTSYTNISYAPGTRNSITVSAGAPATWQQLYCEASPQQPQGACINACQPGYHPGGPVYKMNDPTNGGKEPPCSCSLNGGPSVTQSLVHVHSVQTPQGTTIVDGNNVSYPQVAVGQQITLNGCNFGSSGSIGVQDTTGNYSLSLPTPMGSNWTDTTIKMTVPMNAAAQPDPAFHIPNTSTGALEVQAASGNSQSVYMLVTCAQPTIGGIQPTSVAPGGSIQLTGCGFGSQPGQISLAVPDTLVSTQSGNTSETYVIPTGNGWSGNTITFQIPATVPVGSYAMTAQIPPTSAQGTSYTNISYAPGISNTITVTAPSASGSGLQSGTQFGIINSTTQQFTPSQVGTAYSSTPFVSLWPKLPSQNNGLVSAGPQQTVQGETPAAGWLWASSNMQALIPVQVENYQGSGISLQLEIWQDQPGPLQCDPKGPGNRSPDGNMGSWQPIGSPQNIPVGPLQTIYIPVALNPGVNYLAVRSLYGIDTYNPIIPTSNCPANNAPFISAAGSP